MEIFLNSADIGEIKEFYQTGFVSGITTNPTLASKTKTPLTRLAEEICSIVPIPVSIQVISSTQDSMFEEAKKLSSISKNIIVKLPCNFDGFVTAKRLSENNIKTNLTLCFSTSQAIMAAICKAFYISIFSGRLDDMGNDGTSIIADTRKAYLSMADKKPKILAASISTVKQVVMASINGADIATVNSTTLKAMCENRLSTEGLVNFMKDWQQSALNF